MVVDGSLTGHKVLLARDRRLLGDGHFMACGVELVLREINEMRGVPTLGELRC